MMILHPLKSIRTMMQRKEDGEEANEELEVDGEEEKVEVGEEGAGEVGEEVGEDGEVEEGKEEAGQQAIRNRGTSIHSILTSSDRLYILNIINNYYCAPLTVFLQIIVIIIIIQIKFNISTLS